MGTNYPHYCPICKQVQTIVRSDGRNVDWYFCNDGNKYSGGTILGRFGDDDNQYWSMPLDVLKSNLALANSGSVSEHFNQAVTIYQILRRRKEIE